jgi:UDP:flavonoid glycosyltransferase YjiC (YdhE family)
MCLEKPFLALPMTGQFEQQVNALFLERSGCGLNARRANVDILQTFFSRHAEFKRALQEYNASLVANGFAQYGGSAIKMTLDSLLANNLVLTPLASTPVVSSPVRGSDEHCDTAR